MEARTRCTAEPPALIAAIPPACVHSCCDCLVPVCPYRPPEGEDERGCGRESHGWAPIGEECGLAVRHMYLVRLASDGRAALCTWVDCAGKRRRSAHWATRNCNSV